MVEMGSGDSKPERCQSAGSVDSATVPDLIPVENETFYARVDGVNQVYQTSFFSKQKNIVTH